MGPIETRWTKLSASRVPNGGESDITSIDFGEPILPAFLVTTTNLVEADDEIEACRMALEEIILGPRWLSRSN